jgi:hypothetical protein
VVHNHPGLLFVPAFLKEALAAEKNVLPPNAHIEAHEDKAIISGREATYRYPSILTASAAASEKGQPIVIVGALSESKNFNASHSILETWAFESQNRVFFIVAGPWERIAEEFQAYGDLLCLDI